MSLTPNYYKERVCLNVLANSVENARDCYTAAEGHVVLGVLSKIMRVTKRLSKI